MTQEDYDKACAEAGAISLAHTNFDIGWHKNKWKDVTILICQRKTFEVTRLCIESILRFYPDINILVVDGDSQDESTLYLRYKALTEPNFRVYERIGMRHSHGESLDDAIRNHIRTTYFLTMDNDTIVSRGGFVEDFLQAFKNNPKAYGVGSMMLVSRKNYGCGTPEDEKDILRYPHPSCAMFHRETYLTLVPFNDGGAPLAHNIIDSEQRGLEVVAHPTDNFVQHLSGNSWVKEHQMVWKDDYDVFVRPFITFIITQPHHVSQLESLTSMDFNVAVRAPSSSLRIWNGEAKEINNRYYGIRFTVSGEYICLLNESVSDIYPDFIRQAKEVIISEKAPKQITIGGLILVGRNLFQQRECLI